MQAAIPVVSDATGYRPRWHPQTPAYAKTFIGLADRSPSPGPIQRVLIGEIAPGWRIREPLTVSIELDGDGCYVVSDTIFGVYGEGAAGGEALDDYAGSLLEYYELLSERAIGYPPTAALFQKLRSHVRPAWNI